MASPATAKHRLVLDGVLADVISVGAPPYVAEGPYWLRSGPHTELVLEVAP